jgi:transcriptional regulator with XRE-family HTH domain
MSVNQRFGQRLRVLRMRLGLSQEELAHLCDLDRTYISGVERGKRNICLNNISRIARSLNIRLAELFEGLDDANESERT